MSDIKKPSQEDFDAEFDAFLREENSRMAQLYRKLPHPEPNAALDARVRAQARQALRQHPDTTTTETSSRRPSRARAWLPAFGAAATLVLVAGLAWRLAPPTSSTRETAPAAQVAPAAPAQSDNATAPAPVSGSMQEAAPAQASAEVSARTSQPQRELRRSMAPQTPSSPIVDAAKARAKSAADRTAGAAAGAAAPALVAPTDAAKPTAFPPAANAPMVQSAPPPRAAPPPPALAAEPSTPVAAEQKMMKSAPAPTAAPSTAAPQAAIENRAEAKQAFSDNMPADGPPPIIQPDPADPARYRWELAGNSSPGAQVRSGVYPPDAPPLQTWVAIIRTMLRDGHRDAAKQALADLRARHPDFRVPSDLHSLE
jgi:Meckel syndrome type 1 protein